jgi:hypothetical protein
MINERKINMSKKNNIEELTKAYDEAKANFEALNEQLKIAKQEEEDRKKAELALQQEKRYKEIEDLSKLFNKLCSDYVKDYGHLELESSSDDYDWFPSFWRRNFWF